VTKKLSCFPDTNLFIQCKPIDEWDWALFGDFEAIDVLITCPVQKEIDAHKGKGNTRVASRARTTSRLLREAITLDVGYKEIRPNNPCVRLYVCPELKQDSELANVLSYDEVDDQLVGIVAGFLKNNAHAPATLATHDTGPMASAKLAGVPFTVIPDSWLLPAEEDKAAKELKRLTQELERMKKTEPSFTLNWTDGENSVKGINAVLHCYSPLESYQVATFMQAIKERHLLATDFGGSERIEQINPALTPTQNLAYHPNSLLHALRGSVDRETYIPTSTKEISNYKYDYQQWLQDCEDLLKNLHTHLSASTIWPRLSVELENTGTRSAEKALVTLIAKGDFFIYPFRQGKSKNSVTPVFNRPPQAPQGYWRSLFSQSQNAVGTAISTGGSVLSGLNLNLKREDDVFYYKSTRPSEPASQYALECALWRHQSDTEVFDLTLHAGLAPDVISGVVEVTVQASNVSDVFTQRLPIHIEVQLASTLEHADQLVNDLLSYHI
jgi:PIN domain